MTKKYPKVVYVYKEFDGLLYVLEAKGRFLPHYLPGVAGFLQQSGHYSDILTSDVGRYEGKKMCSLQIDGMITGAACIESANKKELIVSTKSGYVGEVVLA